jgi:hypothetical protein
MLVLRLCTVPRAEVMFVTIQCENVRPSNQEMKKAVTVLKLPDVCSSAVNRYISLSLTSMKSSVHLHALYSPRTALRDQLVNCGQYMPLSLTISNFAFCPQSIFWVLWF